MLASTIIVVSLGLCKASKVDDVPTERSYQIADNSTHNRAHDNAEKGLLLLKAFSCFSPSLECEYKSWDSVHICHVSSGMVCTWAQDAKCVGSASGQRRYTACMRSFVGKDRACEQPQRTVALKLI